MLNNKKIGIVTIHYGINYGSVLQTYASYEYFKENNFDVKIINYIPERYSKIKVYTAVPRYKNIFMKLIYIIAAFPHRFLSRLKFNNFLRRKVDLTKKLNSICKVKKNCNVYDILIAGSDQIWNSDYNKNIDDIYFLNFGRDNTYKFALAASFGKNTLNDEEKDLTKKYLSNFNFITVREDSAKNICEELGYNNVKHVLDPTFLLSKEEWAEKFKISRCYNEKYVLVYVMDNEYKKIVNIAYEIAKNKNLKIYLIAFKSQKNEKVDRCFKIIRPEKFIELFYNAEYIVTNSFHGVAFSVNFNKQFIAVKRDKYNTRIDSILHLFNLDDRLLSLDVDTRGLNMDDIDYSIIDKKVCYERKELYKTLKNELIDKVTKNE